MSYPDPEHWLAHAARGKFSVLLHNSGRCIYDDIVFLISGTLRATLHFNQLVRSDTWALRENSIFALPINYRFVLWAVNYRKHLEKRTGKYLTRSQCDFEASETNAALRVLPNGWLYQDYWSMDLKCPPDDYFLIILFVMLISGV